MQLKDITPYIEQASQPIHSQEDLASATALLSELNKRMDMVTEDKEKLTKPLNASLKAIREKYRPLEQALTGAIDQVRSSLTTYATLQANAHKQAEQKILEDKRTKGDTKIQKLATLEQTPDKVETESGSITFTTITKYRIQDSTKIPPQFLELNTPALKEYLKLGNQLPDGIEVYEEQSLRNYRN